MGYPTKSVRAFVGTVRARVGREPLAGLLKEGIVTLGAN
jgi:hypothetical protein